MSLAAERKGRKHRPRRVHPRARQALEALQSGRCHFRRRGPDADFEPLARQIELVRQTPLTDEAAKLIIYQAFVEGELEAPRHLARAVHENYFRPIHGGFEPRTEFDTLNWPTSML